MLARVCKYPDVTILTTECANIPTTLTSSLFQRGETTCVWYVFQKPVRDGIPLYICILYSSYKHVLHISNALSSPNSLSMMTCVTSTPPLVLHVWLKCSWVEKSSVNLGGWIYLRFRHHLSTGLMHGRSVSGPGRLLERTPPRPGVLTEATAPTPKVGGQSGGVKGSNWLLPDLSRGKFDWRMFLVTTDPWLILDPHILTGYTDLL